MSSSLTNYYETLSKEDVRVKRIATHVTSEIIVGNFARRVISL